MTIAALRGSQAEVLLVGRANIDLTVRVPHRASPGQTVLGSPLVAAPGGKSLNQAIAVARLGGRAHLVANAGDDHWGRLLKSTLADAGVETIHFHLLSGVSTGAAFIEVTPDGENSIVLAVSPETELTASQVATALAETPAAVAVQLDMPPKAVVSALTAAAGTIRIGNLVPHQALNDEVLECLDVLVVNEHEAATILGAGVDAPTAAQLLRDRGPAAAVVTAGAAGAAFSARDQSGMVGTTTVPVVDTTGAGDAFLGCLALGLSRHVALPDAVARAVQVGTVAVQHQGAHLGV